jgi:MFS_1 like family
MAYLTPKLLLFVLHAVLGSAGFYLTLFYRQSLQLSLTAIGIAVAISAFGNLLAGPIWTIIIERYPSRHGQLLAVMMLTGTMGIVALRLAVDWINPHYWQLASYMSAACYGVFALPCCALADYAVLKILGSNSILYGKPVSFRLSSRFGSWHHLTAFIYFFFQVAKPFMAMYRKPCVSFSLAC